MLGGLVKLDGPLEMLERPGRLAQIVHGDAQPVVGHEERIGFASLLCEH